MTSHLEDAHKKQTRYNNKSRRDIKYQVGDPVFKRLVNLSSKEKDITAKVC